MGFGLHQDTLTNPERIMSMRPLGNVRGRTRHEQMAGRTENQLEPCISPGIWKRWCQLWQSFRGSTSVHVYHLLIYILYKSFLCHLISYLASKQFRGLLSYSQSVIMLQSRKSEKPVERRNWQLHHVQLGCVHVQYSHSKMKILIKMLIPMVIWGKQTPYV